MLTIVIPAYNEEAAIRDTIARCRAVFAELDAQDGEIIVVDDASTDNTLKIAREEGVTTISHPQNKGYGRSLKDGIVKAKNDWIAITDADGTYPCDQISILLSEAKRGFDMVVGARTGEFYRSSSGKIFLRKTLGLLVNFTAGERIQDINSGLRVFRKSTIFPYLDTLCDTFSFTTSLTLAYLMTGKYVSHVPIPYFSRIGHSKVHLLKDSLRTLQFVVEAIIFYNPLKIFMVSSIFFLGLAFFAFLAGFIFQIKTGFLLGVGLTVSAFFNIGLGMIAVLLKQILHQIRFRP